MNRLLAAALFTAALLSAQSRNPVQWTVETQGATATIQAVMEPGWHIYALTTPAGGPTPTTIKMGDTKAATGVRALPNEANCEVRSELQPQCRSVRRFN